MNQKKKNYFLILLALIVLLLIIDYPLIDPWLVKEFSNREEAHVIRVIDGDTIETDLGTIRLLGINTPERGEIGYNEAKQFLEQQILNQTVYLEIEKDEVDKYNRLLRYVYYNNSNINRMLVEKGFANIYFLDENSRFKRDFQQSWEDCVNENINLCEKSARICASCIELTDLDINNQEIILTNICETNCNLDSWTIKDEGRKKFIFSDFILQKNSKIKIIIGEGKSSATSLYWPGYDYVFTKTGDTLFLRDSDGKLVLFFSY